MYIDDGLWEEFVNLEKDIMAIIVVLDNEFDEFSHLNLVIYNKKQKLVRRFDPHGYSEDNYNTWLLDYKLKFECWDNVDQSIDYIGSDNTCPFQKYQEQMTSSDGFCAAWCLWYLELLLSNSKIDSYKVEQLAYVKFANETKPLQLIQGYAQFILSIKNTL